jgi:hypothetical protein
MMTQSASPSPTVIRLAPSPAALVVADMRRPRLAASCADAAICADNALPHLLATMMSCPR